MDKGTQQTAATAEESASAAEEMNAQAQQMRMYVEELATVVGVDVSRKTSSVTALVSSAERKPALPEPAAKKKTKIRDERAKNVRPKPGDIIPFGQEEKANFKDF